MTRHWLVLSAIALGVLFGFDRSALAAERYTTENFVVSAPSKELARKFGEYAEKYRREKAIEWLGTEMPRWERRCPLEVKIDMSRTGGATTFTFGMEGRRPMVLSQEMVIFGPVEQLLQSVLPHEVTHTVFAYHFRQAVPRWADEGGSVLSENDEERFSHDVRCRELLNQGRGIPLRVLFTMKEYPRDMIVLYAQGYSITQFLVDEGGREKFLEFVGIGMQNNSRNWEAAVRDVYGYSSVDDLQETWINGLKNPPQRVAARGDRSGVPPKRASRNDLPEATLTGGSRADTRSSAVSVLPQLEPPIVARGATPGEDAGTFGSIGQDPQSQNRPRPTPASASSTPRMPLPRDLGLLPPEPPTRR